MITVVIFTVIFLIDKYLKVYQKTSIVNPWSRRLFNVVNYSDVEELKKRLRYVLVWLSIDYIMTDNILREYFGQNTTWYLNVGCLYFIVALYFLIPQSFFLTANEKTNGIFRKLFMPTLVFGTGAYVFPNMKPGDITGPTYESLSDEAKLVIIKLTSAIFLVFTIVCAVSILINLLFKCFVSLNYYSSNLVCVGIKRLSGHCTKIHPEEPHEVLAFWVQLLMLLISGIVAIITLS
jgi:hypothetical protein